MNKRIRPSSLALTIACNAALQLQESVPPLPPTEEKAEGTAAHWVARRHLAGYASDLPIGAKFHSEGREWTVTPDMYAGAVLYARALGAPDSFMHIEEYVDIPRVHDTESGGTPDMWRFFSDARSAYPNGCPAGLPKDRFDAGIIKLIRCGDYKFGHRFVEVYENPQLSSYVSGVMDKLGLIEIDNDLYVELILVQPRCYHKDGPVRVWRTKAIGLRNILIAANDAASRALIPLGDPFAPMAKTGSHCTDCEARHVCVALQRQNGRIVEFTHTAERAELDPISLGQELVIVQDAIKQLEARETGLAAQAESMLRAGQPVPFFGLKPGRSILTYRNDVTVKEITGFGDMVNVNLRRPEELKNSVVTPTQAIALGIDEKVMEAYAHRPPGALQFTRDSSAQIRKVFAK